MKDIREIEIKFSTRKPNNRIRDNFFLRFLEKTIGGAVIKNPPANIRDSRYMGSIPVLERYPGVGNINTLQDSCLASSMDREA